MDEGDLHAEMAAAVLRIPVHLRQEVPHAPGVHQEGVVLHPADGKGLHELLVRRPVPGKEEHMAVQTVDGRRRMDGRYRVSCGHDIVCRDVQVSLPQEDVCLTGKDPVKVPCGGRNDAADLNGRARRFGPLVR